MWYFTSDLHLSHTSIMRGYRGTIFPSVEEHNTAITNNLLEIPRGSNLAILGDLFWKFNSKQVSDFFNLFQKKKINIHIVIGNHDKVAWFKHKVVKSYGHMKEIVVDKQPITLCHYPLLVYNRSHYGSINLHGHIHKNDNTWEIMGSIPNMEMLLGKSINVNIELWDFKPLSLDRVLEIARDKPDNFDLIRRTDGR